MADLIIHHNGLYNIYGTIADGCHYEGALTLRELRHVIKMDHGRAGLDQLTDRLDRAHRTGCSHIAGWTLDDVIAGNRAGPNESSLSREEFIARFLTRAEPSASGALHKGASTVNAEGTPVSSEPDGQERPSVHRPDGLGDRA